MKEQMTNEQLMYDKYTHLRVKLVKANQELDYWKERCRLAEAVIDKTPDNPYTTKDLNEIYAHNMFLIDNGNKPYKMEQEILYTIYDCNGIEVPLKNGKYRTFEEAFNLVEKLNYNEEYAPYSIQQIN